MQSEYVVVAARYGDLPEADAVFSAVGLLYKRRDLMSTFDAATIGQKATGEVRFGTWHRRWVAPRAEGSIRWSWAAGLAAALYPSVGVDLSAARSAEFELLSACAGAVQRGFKRGALSDLGRHLDAASAGLIVVCRPALKDEVCELLCGSGGWISRSLSVDSGAIAPVCRRHGGGPRPAQS